MAVTHRRLGRHGVLVSNLCLGTMNFGTQTNEKDAFAIMDRALELGINFFDTADVYGWTPRGLTEEIIGRWLAQGGGRREAIVLATKVYNPADREGEKPEPNHAGGTCPRRRSAATARAASGGCAPTTSTSTRCTTLTGTARWEEIWQAMDTLVGQGKVIYVGSSNFAGWDIATACQEAARRGMPGLASEQSIYNLNNRMVELEVIPACRHYGMGLIPWSPLEAACWAARWRRRPRAEGATDDLARRWRRTGASWRPTRSSVGRWVRSRRMVGLAWLLHNPAVTAPIVGPRTIEQLEDAVHATEMTLDAETLSSSSMRSFPARRRSPEGYAW